MQHSFIQTRCMCKYMYINMNKTMTNTVLSVCIQMVVMIFVDKCDGLSGKHVIIHLNGVQELLNADNNVTSTEKDLILSMLEDIKKQINKSTDSNYKYHIRDTHAQTPLTTNTMQNQVQTMDHMINVLQMAFQEEKARSRRDHRFIEHRLNNLESKSPTDELIAMLSLKDSIYNECRQITKNLQRQSEDEIIQHNVQNQTHAIISDLSKTVNTMSKQIASILNTTRRDSESADEDIKGLEAKIERTRAGLEKYASCRDIKDGKSGVYTVYPDFQPAGVQVYCDMYTDGGGWTVFQRRRDGFVDFYRGWDDYKKGFGDLEWEFWLGNDNLHEFTSARPTELRVDLVDANGQPGYGKYALFRIDSESNDYELLVNQFSGNIKDGLGRQNHMKFTTKDRDNDLSRGKCSTVYHGAWWYEKCHNSNLNADYFGTGAKVISWYVWHNSHYTALTFAEMKLRWKY